MRCGGLLFQRTGGNSPAQERMGQCAFGRLPRGRNLIRAAPPLGSRPRPATAVAPSRNLFALASYDGEILVWEISTGRLRTRLPGHTNQVELLQFSPDERLLASYSRGHWIKIWD